MAEINDFDAPIPGQSLTDKPGKLGEVTSLVGTNNLNISSVEMTERGKDYINFKFNLIILNLVYLL